MPSEQHLDVAGIVSVAIVRIGIYEYYLSLAGGQLSWLQSTEEGNMHAIKPRCGELD